MDRRDNETGTAQTKDDMKKLSVKDLILPYFVVEGEGKREKIQSMPGIFRLSLDNLIEDVDEAQKLGIGSILLFGIPATKDESGSEAYQKEGVVQKAVRALKSEFKRLTVITDVCLCAYTAQGHCAILKSGRKVDIDLPATLRALVRIALSHAEAGADIVAPSAMMKGQVKAIRKALDSRGCKSVRIMGYSAKFFSGFYGPFREAADCAPKFGDRSSYQLGFADARKALQEIETDIKEGADIVMVKPALAYLDIIYRARQKFKVPLAAYNVSGEYSLLKGRELILEVLTAIKRAGADLIITYFAKEAAKWLKEK